MNEAELKRELAKLRRENKLLKEFIKSQSTEKQFQAYLKGIKQTKRKVSSYETKFNREAKKLKIKSKLVSLMREYNKIIKASKTKISFPKINIKNLQKQGFIPTAKNLKLLKQQLEETIQKQEDAIEYPTSFLSSMYENIVFNMFKNEFSTDLITIAANLRDSGNLEKVCDKGVYNKEIFEILTLLYDTVANGDEDGTKQLLRDLLNIIDIGLR